ncbi:hypothetical protein F2Q69_00015329 [Brassica cretica]|uniref:50S ribosomal protein L17 n=1 Tax=Brassica cretica TaxID=69181 RepID=A0A8S9QYD8_BRACR|nr:hypothetical protein F2Q69_00015329 [Brassica cretica]
MRKFVDKMITLGKDGSLHKRRQALGIIYEKQIVHTLFAEVPDRYGERNGGYTRIIRTLPRRGDNAPILSLSKMILLAFCYTTGRLLFCNLEPVVCILSFKLVNVISFLCVIQNRK